MEQEREERYQYFLESNLPDRLWTKTIWESTIIVAVKKVTALNQTPSEAGFHCANTITLFQDDSDNMTHI